MSNNPEDQFNGVPDLSDQFEDTPSLPELECYYENGKDRYWLKTNRGSWASYKIDAVRRKLGMLGYNNRITNEDGHGQVDVFLDSVQFGSDVEFVTNIAGHPSGPIEQNGETGLVKSGPELIEPVQGDWSTIREFMESLFVGDRQVEYVYAWLKVGLESLKTGNITQPGQALVLAGEPGNGKSCFQNTIATWILGGRSASPNRYLNGNEFNKDLIGSEHLLCEDLEPKVDLPSRYRLGAKIKEIVANEAQACHPKCKDAFKVVPFWRLTISINSDDDKMLQLPPMESDVATKVMLLKTTRASNLQADKKAFNAKLKAEMPAFVHFLEHEFEIPEELKDHKEKRYGVAAFHHPEIVQTLHEMSPEAKLDSIISSVLFGEPGNDEWSGTATDLETKIMNSSRATEYNRIIRHSTSLGRYLSRLVRAEWTEGRYVSTRPQGTTRYCIYRHPVETTDDPTF